jgi:HTH-type transcriptional regulator/antitoxin HigA
MDVTLVVIENDAELARAHKLVEQLMDSALPEDAARLETQARLIAAYEQRKWPPRRPSTADIVRYLMDQHGMSRTDMAEILGTPSRVSEVLNGKKERSMALVQRLRGRFRVPADVLIPASAGKSRSPKRNAG